MTCFQFLVDLHKVCHFQTTERGVGRASNSEIRRWFQRNSVVVNGTVAKADDLEPENWQSLVLFPKSPRRTTLW